MENLLKLLLIALLAVALTPTVFLMALFTIPLLAVEAISGAFSQEHHEFGGHGLGATRTRIDQNQLSSSV
jgi:hypothetical protein